MSKRSKLDRQVEELVVGEEYEAGRPFGSDERRQAVERLQEDVLHYEQLLQNLAHERGRKLITDSVGTRWPKVVSDDELSLKRNRRKDWILKVLDYVRIPSKNKYARHKIMDRHETRNGTDMVLYMHTECPEWKSVEVVKDEYLAQYDLKYNKIRPSWRERRGVASDLKGKP